MTALRTRPYDSANYLRSEEAIAVYLADALASGDDAFFQHALQVAARARGMSEVAAASGLGRESLYKALAPGAQPRFSTVRKVMGALGVMMTIAAVKPRAKSAGAPRKALAAKTAARKPERAKGRA